MTRFRLIALVLGAVVALDAGAFAQNARTGRNAPGQRPGQDRGQDDGQDRAGPGGDRQAPPEMTPEQVQASLRRIRDMLTTRVSNNNGNNRGGRGGGNGPGGFPGMGGGGTNSMLMLLMSNTALQEEVGLTDDQKEQLRAFQETSRDRMREMFQNMRGNNNNNNGNGRNNGGRPNFNDPQFQAQMQKNMEQMAKEAQSTFSKILDKDQMVRLNQIRLQIVGPVAVAEPEIAQALMLSEDQFAQVRQIVLMMQEQQGQVMQSLRPQGFGGPGGQNGPGGRPQANGNNRGTARNGNVDNEDDAQDGDQGQAGNNAGQGQGRNNNDNNGGRRGGFDPNSPEIQAFRERMEEANAKQDAIRKKAESAIGKVLLQKQRAKFNSMLGPKFDQEALARAGGGGFGGFGGGRGGFGGGNNGGGRGNRRGD
jgi:hypothetical protein